MTYYERRRAEILGARKRKVYTREHRKMARARRSAVQRLVKLNRAFNLLQRAWS